MVFTFNRLLDAKNKLPMRVFFSPVEGVEALGPHQVRFNLSRPYGPFLAVLSQATEIVNEKAVGEKDPKLFPVGTGPFKFVEWVKDDHITLERWDKYFRPNKPYLDRVMFYAPADDTVRLTGLQTGRYNWIQTVPPQRIAELERARDMKSSPGGPYFPFFLMLNASRPPLNDKRLRQAIAWALDRVGDREARLLRLPCRHRRADPRAEPLGHRREHPQGRARPRQGEAAPRGGGQGRRAHPHLSREVAGSGAREDRRDPARAAEEGRHHAGGPAPRVRVSTSRSWWARSTTSRAPGGA